MLMGPQRSLGAVGDAELFEDAGEVRFDRAFADPELASDEFVGEAGGHEPEHLLLTFAQLGTVGAAAATEQQSSGARVEGPVPAPCGAHTAEQVVGLGVL